MYAFRVLRQVAPRDRVGSSFVGGVFTQAAIVVLIEEVVGRLSCSANTSSSSTQVSRTGATIIANTSTNTSNYTYSSTLELHHLNAPVTLCVAPLVR